MEGNSKAFLAFIAGAATGIAIGYFLASENKGEILEDLKAGAQKIKDSLGREINKGVQFVEDLKKNMDEFSGEV